MDRKQSIIDIKWLIEEYVSEATPELLVELDKQGYEYKVLPFDWVQAYIKQTSSEYKNSFFPYGSIVVFVGSLRAARYLFSTFFWYGLTVEDLLRFSVSKYSRYIPKDLMLNGLGYYLPLFDVFNTTRNRDIFIKPDLPFKLFDGQILKKTTTYTEFSMLNHVTDIDLDTWVYCAEVTEDIDYEVRFFCNSIDSYTGSYYKFQFRDSSNPEFIEPYPSDGELHKWVNTKILNLLPVYDWGIVVDIAMTVDGPKVIEFNHPLTSGLYKIDLVRYIDEISRLAYDQYERDLGVD